MKKILTIYRIKSGFLVEDITGEYQHFSDMVLNGDQKYMLTTICKHLEIKDLRVSKDTEWAKKVIREEKKT